MCTRICGVRTDNLSDDWLVATDFRNCMSPHGFQQLAELVLHLKLQITAPLITIVEQSCPEVSKDTKLALKNEIASNCITEPYDHTEGTT